VSYYRFPGLLFNKPASSGGIGIGLFEGFEVFAGGVPTTQAWTPTGFPVLTQSTSNVTQGTYSMSFDAGFNGVNIRNTNFLNFSAITNILMDVKPSGVFNTAITLSITDGTITNSVTTTISSGTATTLTLTPTTVNKAAAKIAITSYDPDDNTQTFYCDNLRCT